MNFRRLRSRLRFSQPTRDTMRGLTVVRSISFAVGLLIMGGFVFDAFADKKPRKGSRTRLSVGTGKPLLNVNICTPSAIPTGTEYVSDSSTCYSFWQLTCATGNVTNPCNVAMNVIINKKNAAGNWVFVEETCIPYTYDCGFSGSTYFWVRGIPAQYGIGNIYQVTWNLNSGTCLAQGGLLGSITSAPFTYFPPLGAGKEPD